MLKEILGKLVGESELFKTIQKAIPDKDKQAEIEKELKLAAVDIEKIREQDMGDARALAAQETKLSLKDPRAWPRPAWAFSALFIWIVSLVKTHFELTIHDYAIIGSVVTFYFGIRTYEKIKNGTPFLGNKLKWGSPNGNR